MTVRTAELLMAIILSLASAGLMWKSTELSIGWVPEKGPGSGFWPFWLSSGMLLTSIWTMFRWFKKQTPESVSEEPYLPREAYYVVGVSVGAILGLLIGTHLIGIYPSLLFFMLFYVRFVGRHGWKLSLALTFGVPLFIFGLFEWALTIPLPKPGWTEPAYYPIYDLMYSF